MASRKEQKQKLREEREQKQRKDSTSRQRKQRLGIAAGAVALAAVAVVVLIVISQSGSSGPAGGAPGAAQVATLLKGIPQHGNTLGDPKAPVTVQEFADLQCPACQAEANDSLPDFISSYVRDGKAKLVFRNLVILGPQSTDAAKAALAAGKQNRAWNFVKIFYLNQGAEGSGYVTSDFLTKMAKSAGLDVAAWNKARQSPAMDADLSTDSNVASGFGFDSTPSFQFSGPGGKQQAPGQLTPEQLKQYVDSVKC